MIHDRERAGALYAEARAHVEARRYREARRCFEASLALHEDEEVRTAYVRLLDTIMPE